MKITIEGASEDFERKLLGLLAEHRDELIVSAGTEWTGERAVRYLTTLPAAARTFALEVIDSGGHAEADYLRNLLGSLRGATIALSRAMPRGVKAGWWPEGTPAPIQPVYDPDNPSWQRAIAYVLAEEHLPAFREAANSLRTVPWSVENRELHEARKRAEQVEREARGNWGDEDAPSALARPQGWGSDDDAPRALAPDDDGEGSDGEDR
ncbi:hypothetical protein [Streptomyces cahuitamycinicus]|uniref:Uncharacterized protein n=1 Tax=Streptomyces cahuitamycinicus TaxID=2070367 RepID=A0A2N8TS93_9ACTN|nr:hypothetical protein [Streptomyces cahuitamycinicus]PNG21892.1 hypothetical protein C1J00_12350 [Streptomyces cahuitamycinicus]